MSFDKIFDLTAGVYFHFYSILEDTDTQYQARSEYHTHLAHVGFDESFNLTAGVYSIIF